MISTKYMKDCLVFSIKKARRLDFYISDNLKKKIEKRTGYPVNNFIIDLKNIHFIDSHSFNVLLQIHKTLTGSGKKLHIINVSEGAQELFELTGLNKTLAIKIQESPSGEIACIGEGSVYVL